MQETGPSTVYRPYPRRLERLTICRCHCKGGTSIIIFLWQALLHAQKKHLYLLITVPLKLYYVVKAWTLVVQKNHLYHLLFFSLGLYAKMIKEALEKTISEGEV